MYPKRYNVLSVDISVDIVNIALVSLAPEEFVLFQLDIIIIIIIGDPL